MKYSIKNLLGITLLISLALIVLRRPIADTFESSLSVTQTPVSDLCQSFLSPYYLDCYLLGIDDYWPFTKKQEQIFGKDFSFFGLTCLILNAISGIIWFVLHIFTATYIYIQIDKRFFKQ